MEAGESGARQSSFTPGDRHGYQRDFHSRTLYHRDPDRISSNMATAALISPNTPYYLHHQGSFPSGSYHSGQVQTHGPPGTISPVESRRTSDDHEPPHRQSLPSIQEVIGKGTGGPYQASTLPPPQPQPPAPSVVPQQSLPSPFTSSAPVRSFPPDSSFDRQPSPRTLPPSTSSLSLYGPRPDVFSNPLRSQFSGHNHSTGSHSSPPPNLESQPRLSPTAQPLQELQQGQQLSQQLPKPLHPHPHNHQYQFPAQRERERELKSKLDETPHLGEYIYTSNQHTYAPQSALQQQQQQPSQQLPLPPAQTPLPASYPVSPRHIAPSSLPSPFEAQPSNCLPDGSPEFGRIRSSRYDQAVNRHFEAWSYAEYLSRIGSNSRTIYNFAEAFGSIAREEHSPQPMPGRMPSDREVCEMIKNAEWLKTMLESLRSIVQQTVINDRGLGNNARQKEQSFEEPETPMYSETLAKPYNLNEVKKRRGRAAPPGRCHSCNRIDTPEWRRGPDGARTLCNACGLHYAKLERKKQLESRALRPGERH